MKLTKRHKVDIAPVSSGRWATVKGDYVQSTVHTSLNGNKQYMEINLN